MALKKRRARRSSTSKLANAVRSETRRLNSPVPALALTTAPRPEPYTAESINLSVPEDLLEEVESQKAPLLSGVMWVITLLGLVFISIIAWLVRRMPAQ